MFGIGGTEILVILIVALLFLGPEKLPETAKQISKGIRDLRKQTRALQQTIEDDEHIGGAIRDLKSALRGEEPPAPPYVPPPLPPGESPPNDDTTHDLAEVDADMHHPTDDDEPVPAPSQADREIGAAPADGDSELALIKPPAGETAARQAPDQPSDTPAQKHG